MVTRWRDHHFCWKLEFWAEFFFVVNSFRDEITSRVFWINILFKKQDCFTVLLATKWVKVFEPYRPIFGEGTDPKLPRSHFFAKRIHQKKISAQNSNFQQKRWWRHLVAKQLQKNFDLWSTQKYSKESKVCSACAEIFLRVSYMLKPTVDCFRGQELEKFLPCDRAKNMMWRNMTEG